MTNHRQRLVQPDRIPGWNTARRSAASDITGDLLKFAKGDFLAGQDNREIAIGTRLIANMDLLEVGWIKWEDSRPIDRRMGRFAEGFIFGEAQ